ncbi:3461_t:CDS:2, partial [Gigaspora rosea]
SFILSLKENRKIEEREEVSKTKKDNERESEPKEKPEEAPTSTHNKAQTYLSTKETLFLKECGTMDYGGSKQTGPTLTEIIIQNSKRPKEDTTVTTQQDKKIFIAPNGR